MKQAFSGVPCSGRLEHFSHLPSTAARLLARLSRDVSEPRPQASDLGRSRNALVRQRIDGCLPIGVLAGFHRRGQILLVAA